MVHRPEPARFPRQILLISDGWLAQMSLCEVLENQGYTVQLAEDAMKGIATLESKTIDLVISVCGTHRMSVVDLLRYIKSREALHHIPVIVLIFPWETQETPIIEQAGAFGIVTAPYHPGDILALIREAPVDQ